MEEFQLNKSLDFVPRDIRRNRCMSVFIFLKLKLLITILKPISNNRLD
jgi:hypothetical protein